jgi:hypothetical protein
MRHRWSEKLQFDEKSRSFCTRCGLVRIIRTRATPDVLPGQSFWLDGKLLGEVPTPKCEPAGAGVEG